MFFSLRSSTERDASRIERRAYQGHVLHFLNWCRTRFQVRQLAQVDARAEELVSAYLNERIAAGLSAYTLHSQRCALRLFFGQRELAEEVHLPRRRQEAITRS